jgi:hypothetical protein
VLGFEDGADRNGDHFASSGDETTTNPVLSASCDYVYVGGDLFTWNGNNVDSFHEIAWT